MPEQHWLQIKSISVTVLSQTNKCPPLYTLWPLWGLLLIIAFPVRNRRIREENKWLSCSQNKANKVHLYWLSFDLYHLFFCDKPNPQPKNLFWLVCYRLDWGFHLKCHKLLYMWVWISPTMTCSVGFDRKIQFQNVSSPLTSLLLNFCLIISSLRLFLAPLFCCCRTVIWKLLHTRFVLK